MKPFDFVYHDACGHRGYLRVFAWNQTHAINKAVIICNQKGYTLLY